jgi:4-amino-4-deoxy-L-arabinose transferase-like glycosyltransferase
MAFLLSVSILFYLPIPAFIGWDEAWYYLHGMNIYYGNGYIGPEIGAVMPTRGPLYPLLIASAFHFGFDVNSAFNPAKLLAILTPLSIYWFGKLTLGRTAGIIAAMGYLTSVVANFSILRPIDNIWSTLSLIGVCFLLKALQKDSRFLALISGGFLGLAYLTKESAILIFPLPFLIWLFNSDYRKKNKVQQIAIAIFVAFVLALSWIVYGGLIRGENVALGAQGDFVLSYLWQNRTEYLSVSFFKNFIDQIFIIPISWAGYIHFFLLMVTVFMAITKPSVRPVVLWIFCLIPLLVYVSMQKWNAGYYTPLYLSMFIASGYSLATLNKWIGYRISQNAAKVTMALFILFFIVQMVIPAKTKTGYFVKQSRLSLNPVVPVEFLANGARSPRMKNFFTDPMASEILKVLETKNIKQAVVIPDRLAYTLAFLSRSEFKPSLLQYMKCHGAFRAETRYSGKVICESPPLSFYYKSEQGNHKFSYVSQNRLFDTLLTTGPYIVTENSGILKYLEKNIWAHKIAGDKRWSIYEVNLSQLKPLDELINTSFSTIKYWQKLKEGQTGSMDKVMNELQKCGGNCFTEDIIDKWINQSIIDRKL